MTTIAETRVLPESLGATWRRMRARLRSLETPAKASRGRSPRRRGR
jgi:hypothetical protein